VTHKASEFTAVGKTPVGRTEYIVTIHRCDEIEGFLPCPREFSHIRVSCPDEPCQPIENRFVKDLEAWCRPGHAASEVRVLSAPGAIDHEAPFIVAGNLPCLEVSAHNFMLAPHRSSSAYFLVHMDLDSFMAIPVFSASSMILPA
jgi:hypothetical protein